MEHEMLKGHYFKTI